MVLESTIICVDNSEYTRNGDYLPTRLQAQQASSALVFPSVGSEFILLQTFLKSGSPFSFHNNKILSALLAPVLRIRDFYLGS
jgi:hypothetical protein